MIDYNRKIEMKRPVDICNSLKNDCHEEKVQCIENKEAFEQKLKETKTQKDFFEAAISSLDKACSTYLECSYCILYGQNRCCFKLSIGLGGYVSAVCLCQGDHIRNAFGLEGYCV
jgi:hypothetical protein